MCNVLCHTFFPIKDTINKTSCPIKSIYYHWQRLLQGISKMYKPTMPTWRRKPTTSFTDIFINWCIPLLIPYSILHYENNLHHLDHDLVIHNNKIEHIKSNLHLKCRSFISGLHILSRNCIPESILHADVFSNILHGVSQYLHKDNVYTLLYGSAVNPYYGMYVVKSFIINDAHFMTISLPLK